LEQWYSCIAKLNINSIGVNTPTIFLELSDQYLTLIQSLSKSKLAQGIGMDRRLTNAELEGELELIDKVGSVMTPQKRYFVRFSTRSPKDGVSTSFLQNPEFQQLSIVDRLKKKLEYLSVVTPQEVVTLITKSQRIFSDIGFFYQYRVPNASSSKLCLILRDFVPDLPVDHEFRCYAKNRKITAISQYQCYIKFDALQDAAHVNKCRSAILAFHQKVAEHLPMEDYVIDIVVFPAKNFECQVIELNPFGPAMSSGSALFHWIKDYNLLHGKLNLEVPPIRILEKLIEDQSEDPNQSSNAKGI